MSRGRRRSRLPFPVLIAALVAAMISAAFMRAASGGDSNARGTAEPLSGPTMNQGSVGSLVDPVSPSPAEVDETSVIQVSLDRKAFSPNEDGVADVLKGRVTSETAGALTLEVFDAAGADVRTLRTSTPISVGETSVRWNGHSDTDRIVADGRYVVRASLVDAAGTSSVAEAAVRVDTVPPSARIHEISPNPVLATSATVTFALRVAGAGDGKLLVTDAAGAVVHRDVWRGREGGRFTRRWDMLRTPGGRRVPPGPYLAVLTAIDAAGNAAESEPRLLRDVHPVVAQVVSSVQGAGRRVALTFDDCDFAGAWARILTLLDRAHAHATFFCPGQVILGLPQLARRTVRRGHTVGAHGWDHADMTKLTPRGIRDRLERDESAWWTTTHAMAIPFVRPPFGTIDADVRAAAGATGYRWIVLWSVDPRDWERPGPSVIASRVLSHVYPGSIVVMHTDDQTAAALPAILRGLANRRLQPVSLVELISEGTVARPVHQAKPPERKRLET